MAGVGEEASAPSVEASPVPAKPLAADEVATPAVEEAWFVRPPAGGQFGPASPADFALWIQEGRVTADAHVWRTGWADWRRATEVAVELPAPLPLTAMPVASLPAVPPALQPLEEPLQTTPSGRHAPAAKRPRPRRKQSARRQLLVAVVLLVMTLILGGILAWVLQRQSPPATSWLDVKSRCPPAGELLG